MRFGKIEYLNLAPFDVFSKRYGASSSFKKILSLHTNYPSKLNHEFLFRRIDAGFISSVVARPSHFKVKPLGLGIITEGEVWSVLCLEREAKSDYQSATSNALCKVLGLEGEVLIGDRALRYYHENKECDFIDMGKAWLDKKRLPFVYGRLCCNANEGFYNKMAKAFARNPKIFIPSYIMDVYAKRLGLKPKFMRAYLDNLYYVIGKKEALGLSRFYRDLRLKRIKPVKRY
ncbi:menaquinone biosynthesis protein [Helicobacter sp. 13S00401-1]|uniref:MqnA/MqnD/SBP family protein n=1 Tax=Helicobacter sp. 13S00401-1 TaxID=1905758 RepID=UPI000BA799A7|nr:MqnA/MqnD/SBP family protein [Helicobacter sp. 13S00401-1]PAF51187.1 menaquinone biosynthesis protein [Helicobacter sp. 13S00401-1]